MIIDSLDNIARYKGLLPALDPCIAFLQSADLAALPFGAVEANGGQVVGNHFTYQTATADTLLFENHRQHIDFHVVISGQEEFAVAPVDTLQTERELPEEDSTLLRGAPLAAVPAYQGTVVLVFPGEAHMPKRICGTSQEVNKLVLKIPYEPAP